MEQEPIGLYLHIPFCRQKCLYCDFPSFSGQERYFQAYVAALKKEIRVMGDLCQQPVSSVFIGGGTPTVLSAEALGDILRSLQESFFWEPNAEVTVEANPGTLDDQKAEVLFAGGVNRVSMGLQAWQETLLRRLGRIHDRADFLHSVACLRKAGFTNINVDLMFALPGQTVQDWEESLRAVAELGLPHISAYSLIVEEGTPFYKLQQTGNLILPDEETERTMYEMTESVLAEYGLQRYEISNYAKPGMESRHNSFYWQGKEYIGMGFASHSYWKGIRYHRTGNLKEYFSQAKEGVFRREEEQILSQEDKMSEFFFLGLRQTAGVSLRDFFHRFGQDAQTVFPEAIASSIADGLLCRKEDRLVLTKRGLDLSNQVFMRFV